MVSKSSPSSPVGTLLSDTLSFRKEMSPCQHRKRKMQLHVLTSCPQPLIRDCTHCSSKLHKTQYVPRTEYMFQSRKGWCWKPGGERACTWNQKNELQSHHHVIRYVRSISRLQFSFEWRWNSRNTRMVVPSTMVPNSLHPSQWDVYSLMPFALWLKGASTSRETRNIPFPVVRFGHVTSFGHCNVQKLKMHLFYSFSPHCISSLCREDHMALLRLLPEPGFLKQKDSRNRAEQSCRQLG